MLSKALNIAIHSILSKPTKALPLLLKIQSSTASSSLLFPMHSAQQLPLISSALLSPLSSSNVFFTSRYATFSVFPPTSVSLVSSWTFNICLEILCYSLLSSLSLSVLFAAFLLVTHPFSFVSLFFMSISLSLAHSSLSLLWVMTQ